MWRWPERHALLRAIGAPPTPNLCQASPHRVVWDFGDSSHSHVAEKRRNKDGIDAPTYIPAQRPCSSSTGESGGA